MIGHERANVMLGFHESEKGNGFIYMRSRLWEQCTHTDMVEGNRYGKYNGNMTNPTMARSSKLARVVSMGSVPATTTILPTVYPLRLSDGDDSTQ